MNTPSSFDSVSLSDRNMLNYAMRMMVPFRREFGRSLDVMHFLHDFSYAKEIIDQAKSSEDLRLREYASYFEAKLLGPRDASGASRLQSSATSTPLGTLAAALEVVETADVSKVLELSEAELRARMLSKYKSGLR
jgi:hypothetical protein